MKKYLIILISALVLTGCSYKNVIQIDSEEEAVLATKASIEGVLKGDSAYYESYYGVGTYEKKIENELEKSTLFGISTPKNELERKKAIFKLSQKLLKHVAVDYKVKSSTEVIVFIHSMKMEADKINQWLVDSLRIGKISNSDVKEKDKIFEYIVKAIDQGELELINDRVVEEIVYIKKSGLKYEVDIMSQQKIISAMITKDNSSAI